MITNSASSETATLERSVLKKISLPNDSNLVYWDYSPKNQSLLAYNIETKQLVQVNNSKSVTTAYSLDTTTLIDTSFSPLGNKVLIHVVLPNGNNQYVIADIQNKTAIHLPITIQSVSWLPNDEITYIYNDANSINLSRTADFSLKKWSRISSLDQPYSTLVATPDGQHAIIIPSKLDQNALLINLTDGSSAPLTNAVTWAEWVDNRYALLQQNSLDQTGAIVVIDATTKTASGLKDAIIPAAAIVSDKYIIGLSVITNDNNSQELQALVINTETNNSQTQKLQLDLTTDPDTVLADPNNKSFIIGSTEIVYVTPIDYLLSQLTLP